MHREPATRPLRRVLIADHEPGTSLPLKYLMEQSGYEAHIAASGEEALRLIADLQPDLVLLEAMLADPVAVHCCQIVRSTPRLRGTRVVFVSAMAREVDIAKGLALGADAYITKPFANSEIMDHVRKLLDVRDGSEE